MTTPLNLAAAAFALPPETLTRITQVVARVTAQLREAFDPFAQAMATTVWKVTTWVNQMDERANDPVRIAGLEGRYYVRAALDPAYATPDALDALLATILDPDGEEPGLWLLSPENRRTVAAAAMAGWAVHRRGPVPSVPLVWHRALGSTHVQVSAA